MIRTIGLLVLTTVLVIFAGTSAAAGVTASRKQIRIDAQARGYESCTGKFLLSLGADLDAGKTECRFLVSRSSGKTPEGMQFDKVKLTSTFTGKKGSIATVATGRIYDLAFGIGDVWEGTWKIVKSTDSYEGMRGSGIWKGADDRPHHTIFTQYAGIVATP